MTEEDELEAARQRRIADACLRSDAPAPGRLRLYRRLVQGNLTSVARRLLPRTAERLDAVAAGSFEAWFARFLAEAAPRTPYLRDVPGEFVAWASPRWAETAEIPPFLGDLARYEMDRFLVESAPAPAAKPPLTEVSVDRPLVFGAPRMLGRYAYPVQDAGADPAPGNTCVLIHRDEDNEVHATAIDPRMADLLGYLLAGAPLVEAIAWTAARDEEPKAMLAELAGWLARLGERGALLGGQG